MIEIIIGCLLFSGMVMGTASTAGRAVSDALATGRASKAGAWDFLEHDRDRRDAKAARRRATAGAAWKAVRERRHRQAGGTGQYRPGAKAYVGDVYTGWWADRLANREAKRAHRGPVTWSPGNTPWHVKVDDAVSGAGRKARERWRGRGNDLAAVQPTTQPPWAGRAAEAADPPEPAPSSARSPNRAAPVSRCIWCGHRGSDYNPLRMDLANGDVLCGDCHASVCKRCGKNRVVEGGDACPSCQTLLVPTSTTSTATATQGETTMSSVSASEQMAAGDRFAAYVRSQAPDSTSRAVSNVHNRNTPRTSATGSFATSQSTGGGATGDAHDVESARNQCDLLEDDLTAINTALDVLDEKIDSAGSASELIEAFLRSKNAADSVVGGMTVVRDMLSPTHVKALMDAVSGAVQGVRATRDGLGTLEEAAELLEGADGSILNGR